MLKKLQLMRSFDCEEWLGTLFKIVDDVIKTGWKKVFYAKAAI